jgi:alanyl-tRNA synthetase
MRAAEIRSRFLKYFERNGHVVRPSSSLVPADDPTLLFTNAGMVQFKKVFLGLEGAPDANRRAVTSQKCVRAGGKHNDLEQVGHTYRHHTFFEMLGNFSFGDYFKRDAIMFGWEFVTKDLGIDAKHIRISVHHKDDESRALWKEVADLPDSRIYGLSDADNFWQMADTGPCGPCSEMYVDLAHLTDDWEFPDGAKGEWTDLKKKEFSQEAFVEGAEAGRFLEIWNLVFMQYDKQPDGTLVPLPKPSVDTGLGLDRVAAVMQGVTSNYHTDQFAPLIAKVEQVIGLPYGDWPKKVKHPPSPKGKLPSGATSASFRVLAEHARSVAFLLADGVFPSNEGRGYVLRRILRRGVRHAWLLGRREPTLAPVVDEVITLLGDAWPELVSRREHLLKTTRVEEESFLATIEGGLSRFEQIAPAHSTQGGDRIRGTISGEDAFRLYDTFGFPIDLTELMARERGYTVDLSGFEMSLQGQRRRSQEVRRSQNLGVVIDELSDMSLWKSAPGAKPEATFVGYGRIESETDVTAVRNFEGGRIAVMLKESPFYAESGGQISDRGSITGDGWRVDVDDVKKIDGRPVAIGALTGTFKFGRAKATIPGDKRLDTERNHTATHLLHAALREALGESVHQAGSLVSPDRLRFDFTHHGGVKADKLDVIEKRVNEHVWKAIPVSTREMAYSEAQKTGAMALFGEKYGDVVRVVTVPGYSIELCGGTHVRNTSEIGLFRIVQETGVASGVRRIEAVTGPGAFEHMRERERTLVRVAETLKTTDDGLEKRIQSLLDERRALEKRVDEALRGGGDQVQQWLSKAEKLGGNGGLLVSQKVTVTDARELQALGDALREQLKSGVGVLGSTLADGKTTVLVVVTDDLKDRGIRADTLVREIVASAGGKGGGKPHMAQAGLPDASQLDATISGAAAIVPRLVKHQ